MPYDCLRSTIVTRTPCCRTSVEYHPRQSRRGRCCNRRFCRENYFTLKPQEVSLHKYHLHIAHDTSHIAPPAEVESSIDPDWDKTPEYIQSIHLLLIAHPWNLAILFRPYVHISSMYVPWYIFSPSTSCHPAVPFGRCRVTPRPVHEQHAAPFGRCRVPPRSVHEHPACRLVRSMSWNASCGV